jgi:hypothetical protein
MKTGREESTSRIVQSQSMRKVFFNHTGHSVRRNRIDPNFVGPENKKSETCKYRIIQSTYQGNIVIISFSLSSDGSCIKHCIDSSCSFNHNTTAVIANQGAPKGAEQALDYKIFILINLYNCVFVEFVI